MPATVSRLGPGTLLIGEAGSEIDLSCQVQFCQIVWDKSKDDDITVLCGDVVAGATTRTAQLTGNLFQDTSDPTGIVQQSWGALKGATVPFTFIPNTVDAVEATGEVTIDPVTIGADEASANMASDFTWDIVGEPTLGAVTP